jgi:uncharacterized protein YndB with AHSA1/START domain
MPAASDKPGATTERTFSMSIDIGATPEDVWRALTDAGEITRWFALQARVTPGKGGTVFWGWDEQFAWESQIDAWEPNRRLTLVEHRPAFDVKGQPLPEPARQLAMEFTLESHAGKTRLRLVHSGFGDGASWDDELESVSAGWQFELRGLKHYLERHHGRDRHTAAAHGVTPLGIDDVWRRLTGAEGFGIDGALAIDERVIVRLTAGDTLSGTVAWHNPGRDLFVRAAELADGVFRLSAWRAGGSTGVQAWATTYAPQFAGRVRELGAELQQTVDRLFK